MEENNNLGRKTGKICKSSLCRIMVPILVILLLGFGAVSLIDSFYHTRGKSFVVLAQQGIEIQRIAIEPWKDKVSEVPVWYQGRQYHLKIEVNGGAARLMEESRGRARYQGQEDSPWIYDSSDSYTYEPLKLKLYFE
ncbi:hypothetical protein J3A84_09420 [Proteiniclasticum sp. SCR006]|uniref:Uncharacterized protein n=1 Tax=Proteiniclasticum aestuarii TaxID=2817862 RepID=A0A939KJP3_9CLOT|nr:hypothetical protein [Proteiniclasticum aestuarii]MBO1265246.1 hypothetical protein [Proteiniclasticum aestuarii]